MQQGEETRSAPTANPLDVPTSGGFVRGRWRDDSAAFLGIPFAEPPVGDLRFAAPVQAAGWDGVRDATRYGATPQRKPFADVTIVPEPTIDGASTLNVNVASERVKQIPLLLGTTANEFVQGDTSVGAAEVDALRAAGVSNTSRQRFEHVVRRLGVDQSGGQLVTTVLFRSLAASVAAAHSSGRSAGTWMYDFTRPNPRDGAAGHCYELPFAWDLLERADTTPIVGENAPQELATRMHSDWVRMIVDGNPGWHTWAQRPGGAMRYDEAVTFDEQAYRLEAELAGVITARV